MTPPQDANALDAARARFLGGLNEKAGQMRELIDHLIETPSDPEHRTALRSHLQALYTSARVYRVDDLADALQEEIEHIDSLPAGDFAAEHAERLFALPTAYEQFSASFGTGTHSLSDRKTGLRKRSSSGSLPAPLGSLTVKQLADRVAEEVRGGLVAAIEDGSEAVVSLGDGSEVLAPLWSAIGRIQATIAERSKGRVRFKASTEVPMITVTGSVEPNGEPDPSFSLRGYTVLIADDDPAVIWFFSNLLRELGAHVMEALDGAEALSAARRQMPDLILADILMPRLDGLALCRVLGEDPVLESVPVILLSWQEDFLERMRELRAGAEAYLRKEASSHQILQKIQQTLEPRFVLEQQLREEGDVRGRVEVVGVVLLLRAVSRLRPNAQVSLQDPWSQFELTYQEGRLVEATKTAIDGSFVRGAQALRPLVGGSGGRFVVTQSSTAKAYVQDLEEAFADAVADLRAAADAVRGSELGQVANVEFDLSVLTSFLRSSPTDVRVVAEQLASGRAPMELVEGGEASFEMVESVLSVLARRAGIEAVRGMDGEDRIALARENDASDLDDADAIRSNFDRALDSADNDGVDALLREAARTEAALAMQAAPPNAKPNAALDNTRFFHATTLRPSGTSYPDRPGRLGWAFIFVVAAVAGLLMWRTVEIRKIGSVQPTPEQASTHLIELGPVEIRVGDSAQDEIDSTAADERFSLSGFAGAEREDLPEGVSVVPGQGALVVESAGSGEAAVVYLNDVEVGLAPQTLVVPSGRHEVALRVHDDVLYRFTYVHSGKTRVVRFP